jgi:transposase
LSNKFADINEKELDELIQRVTDAKEHNLALSPEDCQLLLDALLTLASLQERLKDKDITAFKLKKLLGMVRSSEKLSDAIGRSSGAKSQKKSKKSNKQKPKNKVKAEVKHHSLTEFSKGDQCPKCETGKLYKYDPATLLRITGQTPFVPVQHVMERLRCNACGAYFTAPQPDEVLNDGESNQKYGYSARSLMGLAKHFGGSPFYRQGSLQDMLGMPITASTIFDQTEYLANDLSPVFNHLKSYAANAVHFCIDDTTHRILDQKPILKKQRNSEKMKLRKGIYTSGIIATTAEEHRIIICRCCCWNLIH